MNAVPVRILVATDVAADATLVRRLLSDEFDDIHVSTDESCSVSDFESVRPSVLVLAFHTLEKAERYYLGLYRLGGAVHGIGHRTVILCGREDLQRVYVLCRREYFDDYVLFWPMTHDATRLPLAVHHAARAAAGAGGYAALARDLARYAGRVAELEEQLARCTTEGEERVDRAGSTLRQAQTRVDEAIDALQQRMSAGDLRGAIDVRDPRRLAAEVARVRTEEVDPQFSEVGEMLAPVRGWIGGLRQELGPQIESARAFRQLAATVRPLVLVVDDDAFQREIVREVLAESGIEVADAARASEAFAMVRRRRPDLILMDVNLPDASGIDATRQLKSVESQASIPVIMMTGRSDRQVVFDSLKVGAAAFLVKPWDRARLLAHVQRHLGHAAAAEDPPRS